MDFVYYIKDNGTKEDKSKDREDLLTFLGMGYIAFAEERGGRITVYRPFQIGIPNIQFHRQEKYQFHVRGSVQEC